MIHPEEDSSRLNMNQGEYQELKFIPYQSSHLQKTLSSRILPVREIIYSLSTFFSSFKTIEWIPCQSHDSVCNTFFCLEKCDLHWEKSFCSAKKKNLRTFPNSSVMQIKKNYFYSSPVALSSLTVTSPWQPTGFTTNFYATSNLLKIKTTKKQPPKNSHKKCSPDLHLAFSGTGGFLDTFLHYNTHLHTAIYCGPKHDLTCHCSQPTSQIL